MLTEADIHEYQELYKCHYGKSIDYEKAAIQAKKLYLLVKVLLKPVINKNEIIITNKNEYTNTKNKS